MTAAEKARELVEKFYYYVYIPNYTSMHEVKQCALIAVDEILSGTGLLTYIEYWQEVKTEIENL